MAERPGQAGAPNNRGARRGAAVPEPQPWYNRFPWALGTLLLNVGIVVFHLGYSSGTGDEKLGNIEKDVGKIERGLEDIKKDVGGIKERLVVLELATPHERLTAAAAGLKDPQFVPVSLSLGSPPQRILSGPDKQISYSLEFKIEEVTQEHIVFLLSGFVKHRLGTADLKDNRIELPLQVGGSVNLARSLEIFGITGIPDLWVVVADRPSEDKAILAVGPKTSTVS